MIRLYDVGMKYPGGAVALAHVNLTVAAGEFVFLVGPSGAGKTTLLRLMLRHELPTEGEILVGGRNVGALPAGKIPALRRSIGVVFQDFKLIRRKTALENVAYVLNVAGHSPKEQKRRAYEALRGVGLHHRLGTYPHALSGGEQQRVAIARAIVNEPLLLLADEPSGNLDPRTGDMIYDLLFELRETLGQTMLLSTHSMRLASRCDRVLELKNGRLHHAENFGARAGTPRAEGS